MSVALNHGANIFSILLGTDTSTQVELMACDKENLAKGGYEGNFDMAPIPNGVRDKKFVYEHGNYSVEGVHVPEYI